MGADGQLLALNDLSGGDGARSGIELTEGVCAELLDVAEWGHVLESAARGTGLAVALTKVDGTLVGACHNAQPVWRLARQSNPPARGECPFCLLVSRPCTAVTSALQTNEPVLVADQARLTHVAIPLVLQGQTLGVVLAGQVFEQFPEQLPVEGIARHFGVSAQTLWQLARQQRPFGRERLRTCGELLSTLASTFLQSRLGIINERWRAAQTLALSRDVAEHQRLTAALRESEGALREADRRKDEFLAMLAHELRNPLAPISTALEIVRARVGAEPQVSRPIGIMQRQVGHMVRLLDDLLEVSRVSRGKIELRREPSDLAAIVDHGAETARPLLERKRQELSVSVPETPIYVYGDPNRLAQVIGNLLNNASKFTNEGGRVALSLSAENGRAVLRVSDDGIGIAAHQLTSIFELFVQVDASLERSRGGLGIGLALVRKLVEMHGGRVEAESAGIGRGTTFVVELPVLSRAELELPAPVAAVPARPRRILVVDDNPDAVDSLAALLASSGHEVHVARDGLEAVEEAQRLRPEIILLDIGLPLLNGLDAARRIRGAQGDACPVLIALTGLGQERDRRSSEEAGFDAHMVKPVDYALLTRLLAEPPRRLANSRRASG